MQDEPLSVAKKLRAAFTKQELEFLETQPRFADACDASRTSADFVRLSELAEKLLKAHARATPAARQLRSTLKQTPELRLRKKE